MRVRRPVRLILTATALASMLIPMIGTTSAPVATAGGSSGARVVYVAGNSRPPADDRPIINRLRSLGYDVTAVDDDSLTFSSLAGADLVMVASSVLPTKIPVWLGDVGVPLFVSEAYVFDDLRLATSSRDVTASSFDGGMPLVEGSARERRSARRVSPGARSDRRQVGLVLL